MTDTQVSGLRADSSVKEQAESLLEEADLLTFAGDVIANLGLVGEWENADLVFLAGVGGMLGKPLHLIVKGGSSGGKNTLVEKACAPLPDDQRHFVTHMSPKYLTRAEGPVTGVLAITEAEGQDAAEYTLRAAMSEGEVVNYTLVPTEEGGWEAEEQGVEVSASLVTTTTSPHLHPENENRVFELQIDESAEQTDSVVCQEARRWAEASDYRKIEEDTQFYLAALREALDRLEPAEVQIPYAVELAKAFPKTRLRARRDVPRLLNLIAVHALLHQRQREGTDEGLVVAELDDYRAVRPLVQATLGENLLGFTDKALEVADVLEELAGEGSGVVKRVKLVDKCEQRGVATDKTVRKWIDEFDEAGAVKTWRQPPNGPVKIELLQNPNEEPALLPEPDELAW